MTDPWESWTDLALMATEYRTGATVHHLASKHHHKYAALGRWLRSLGIMRRQGPQPKTLASIEDADKGRTAEILNEYRRGTPVGLIRTMFHVGSAVLFRITDRAKLPRRKRRTRPSVQQKQVEPHWSPHKIPAAVKLARMESSATWQAFFKMRLEGRGPAYSIHVIHTLRHQQTEQTIAEGVSP